MGTNDRVVVIGASGFGRECLDVLEAMIDQGTRIEIVGVVDDSPSEVNLQRLQERGVRYVGTVGEWLGGARDEKYLLAINSTDVRRRLVERFDAAGLRATRAVHPSVALGTALNLGEGVVICAGSTISTNVHLGRHVHINPSVTIGHDAVIDEFVSVNPAAIISGEVNLGRGGLVGAGAIVLQELRVGENVTVGAAALVTKDVPAGVVVTGVPGRWHG